MACKRKKELRKGGKRALSLMLNSKTEKWERRKVRGFMFELSGVWAPVGLKLSRLGNPICGPQMRSTKKSELHAE